MEERKEGREPGALTPLQASAAESPQGPHEHDERQESSHRDPDDDGQAQGPYGGHTEPGGVIS